MDEELKFNNYKEKQNYYRDKAENRGTTIFLSKIVDKNGKVLQPGKTYTSDKGDARKFRRIERIMRKHK